MIALGRIGLVGVLLCGIPAAGYANPQTYQQLLASTGWIIAPRDKNTTAGTGWLVSRKDRLVVTAAHLVLDTPDVLVYFPKGAASDLVVESGRYLREHAAIAGKVLLVDQDRDLAVVCLESLPANSRELALAAGSAQPGETVHSIGNSGSASNLSDGILWRYTRGQVRQIFEQKAGPRGSRKIRMLETQSPINEGDSGGAVVNDRGNVVGVVSFYKADEQLVSYNVDVREVKAFLDLAKTKMAATADSPPSPRADVIGSWSFRTRDAEGQTATGASTFRRDGTYEFGSVSEQIEEPPERGRFTYANGVLWLISEDGIASFALSWTGRSQFTARVNAMEFRFERAGKK